MRKCRNIKRIKKGGHEHHGGAWKIAYADFVTAMMAFFLLMWLLGSTSEGDKKGIADYFANPLKVSLLASGSGAGHQLRGKQTLQVPGCYPHQIATVQAAYFPGSNTRSAPTRSWRR